MLNLSPNLTCDASWSLIEDSEAESLTGGAKSNGTHPGMPLSININVSPTILVAPLLTTAINSFNYFGVQNSLNGNNGAFNGLNVVAA
jgi:hypothetical protein